MDPELETGRLILLCSCQIQLFESPEVLAQGLMEKMVIVTHTVSEPEHSAQISLTGVLG